MICANKRIARRTKQLELWFLKVFFSPFKVSSLAFKHIEVNIDLDFFFSLFKKVTLKRAKGLFETRSQAPFLIQWNWMEIEFDKQNESQGIAFPSLLPLQKYANKSADFQNVIL